MPGLTVESVRFRHTVAIILLVVTGVFALVALSQLFIGAGADPRETLGSRAAGFGFTDRAHATLFGILPLALPLLAALLSPHPTVRLAAAVAYVVLILIGLIIAVTAFSFGLDAAQQQRNAAGMVFIDSRFAVEQLVLDAAVLTLTTVAMSVPVRAWRRDRAAASR